MIDERTNEQMNEWMNEWFSERTYLDVTPPSRNEYSRHAYDGGCKEEHHCSCNTLCSHDDGGISSLLSCVAEQTWVTVSNTQGRYDIKCFSRGASEQSRTGQDRIGQDRTGLTARWTFSCWPFASFMSLILISKKSVFSVISSKERRPLHTRDCERDGDGERRRRRETKRRERERGSRRRRMDPRLVVENKHNSMKRDNSIRWDRKEITFWTQSWKVNDN